METIKENREFRRAYHKGSKGVSTYIVIYCLKNRTGNKYGITVSKKIGKAVVRNRVKRLIRESFRAYADSLNEALSIVIVARTASAKATFAQIDNSLKSALIQVGALSD
ncbi:MAG: ribonuclease P protein component [Clostridia bacterium]|nr:ribonuclease P protein component [Clostridia bacterium]